ncbi:YidC/Oxa1 family membrane protein insertase [Kineococcus xinjiangensis]|uniref:Membrane protein insertase YidC n=1 Tax=Kineococcus xinjiangensis TaxID=512762 RepID=A0A2S6II26_9ACTN|nr:membrane protein insertase YidC [Kineococcus xinjiangensis]PPK93848.1 YidC/Oxa1 family membrane protein insertase [Kineococcus xinjiangensis]
MIDFFFSLIRPIQSVVAWIMVRFHDLFTALGMDPAGGPAWALSIVGLVIVVRIVLIPLFVKQIKAMRGMQLIQPEMRKIQQKYKGKTDTASRQAMQQEMMALYRESGTNPMASCLPILLQMPIFLALFWTLNGIKNGEGIGALTDTLAEQARDATLFGAPLSATFWANMSDLPTVLLTVTMIVLMSLSQFITQKQLMAKNTSSAMDENNPFAQQQKMMLYLLPVIFAVSGVHFPIGVLLYWLTTNFWSMGQQFYVIRRMPSPGSLAEKELEQRKARKAARRGKPLEMTKSDVAPEAVSGAEAVPPPRKSGQRHQPKRAERNRRPRPGTPPASGGSTR